MQERSLGWPAVTIGLLLAQSPRGVDADWRSLANAPKRLHLHATHGKADTEEYGIAELPVECMPLARRGLL